MIRTSLHFGNIALNKGESASPGLWFDHLWCPSLGMQGSILHDLCGQKALTITSPRWSSDYLYEDGANSSRFDLSTWLPLAGKSEITILSWIRPTANATKEHALWCCETSSGYAQCVLTMQPSAGTHRFTFYTRDSSTGTTGARNNDISTSYYTLIGSWVLVAATYSVTSGEKAIYVNGVKAATSTTSIDTLTSEYTSMMVNCSAYEYPYILRGDTKMLGIAFRALSSSQIMALSADPLLPLRRKTMVSMYIQETPGGTFKPYWYRNKNILIGA